MNDQDYLKASDGTGNAVLATIQSPRSIGSDTLVVDFLTKWPEKFIVTTGTVDANGFIDPATVTEMTGHLEDGNIIIDAFEPGHTDNGNTTGQVAIVKQTTGWANRMASALRSAIPAGIVNQYAGATAPTGWLVCDGSAVSRTTYADLFTAIGTAFGPGDNTSTFNIPDFRSKTAVGVGSGSFSVNTTSVDSSNDALAFSTTDILKFQTGMSISISSTGSLPSPLSSLTTYYVVCVSSPANSIKLASTRANAVAGTVIDLTSNGTGTISLNHSYTPHSLGDSFGEDAHSMTISEMPSHRHRIALDNTGGWAPTSVNSISIGASSADPGEASDQAGIYNNSNLLETTGGSNQMNITQPSLVVNYIIKI